MSIETAVVPAPRATRRSGFFRRFRRNPLVVAATAFVIVAGVGSFVFAPLVDPFAFGPETYGPPSLIHPMGTDHLGRDIFAQVIHGTRSAFIVGVGASLLAALIGTLIGATAGYFGGGTSEVLMRLTDVMLSVPTFFVVLLVGILFGGGLIVVAVLIGITAWTGTARVVRAEVLAQRERGYVEAARVIGASNRHLLLREVLPNSIHPAIALISLIAAWAILAEAGLSFLGLRDTSTVTFGWMLSVALEHYSSAWWMVVFPGLALSALAFAFNLIGDGFNDALNPRVREGRRPAAKVRRSQPQRAEARDDTLLSIQSLSVDFPVGSQRVRVVNDVSLSVASGEIVGLVGESGSGKTMTALSIAGLLPNPGFVAGGDIWVDGINTATAGESQLAKIRASIVAIAFQDPQSALNPLMTVGDQILEAVVQARTPGDPNVAVVQAMETVRIPAAKRRARAYPHQLSGGMRQRVLLAMALVRNPKLLILDEPTTALDVITQNEILDLIRTAVAGRGLAVLLITHDLSVVAQTCDRVDVMYCGRIVESAATDVLLRSPKHPYTQGLVNSVPGLAETGQRLVSIPGNVPLPDHVPPGCAFHPRCPAAMAICRQELPPTFEVALNHGAACWLADPAAQTSPDDVWHNEVAS